MKIKKNKSNFLFPLCFIISLATIVCVSVFVFSIFHLFVEYGVIK